MGNFELIKLASDVLLVTAVCFLSFRILSSGSLSGKTAQLMILEASLKGLIKDAEGTGRSLNDELQKRQYGLEKLLNDLEGIEKRVGQLQNGFEQGRAQIDAQVLQAQHILAQITKLASSTATNTGKRPGTVHLNEAIVEIAPEPPSFETVVVRQDDRHKLPERKNTAAAREEVLQKQRLASKIEREIETPSRSSGSAAEIAPSVERTANQIESAARDVRKISEQVDASSRSNERAQSQEDASKEADPRLGVLGAMKRQIQTL